MKINKSMVAAGLTVLAFVATSATGWCLNPQPLPPRHAPTSVTTPVWIANLIALLQGL